MRALKFQPQNALAQLLCGELTRPLFLIGGVACETKQVGKPWGAWPSLAGHTFLRKGSGTVLTPRLSWGADSANV